MNESFQIYCIEGACRFCGSVELLVADCCERCWEIYYLGRTE